MEDGETSDRAFSYFSISSATSSNSQKKLSKYVKCLKSTLKWRSIVLQKKNQTDVSHDI